MNAQVQGYCPACGGGSLFLGSGGFVTCSRMDCTDPTSASDILDDRETEHVVTLTGVGFTIRHPLRERLHDGLWMCPLHERLAEMDGPPGAPGRYRVFQGERLTWQPMPEVTR